MSRETTSIFIRHSQSAGKPHKPEEGGSLFLISLFIGGKNVEKLENVIKTTV
jgi:hypothetical protein